MIEPYLRAGYPYLALVTHEPEQVAREFRAEGFTPVWWDVVSGGRALTEEGGEVTIPADDPLAPFAWAMQQRDTVLFYANAHKFAESLEWSQTARNAADILKSQGTTIVFIGPLAKIPPELERLIPVIEYPLPGKETLEGVIRQTAKDAELPDPSDESFSQLLDASAGLTAFEAESAMALSIVKGNTLDPAIVFEQKAQMIARSGALSIGKYRETFGDVGGLDALKQFCVRSLGRTNNVSPRGVLLLGVPGTGKSMFAKALGNETGMQTVAFDPASVFGSLVGESEGRVRSALSTIDALGPSIVFIDEIEKAFSGSASSGQSDGGTTSRVFGTFVKWMNDRADQAGCDSYIVATCNDVRALPPEFSRAERWDCLFFIDLPGTKEREKIWRLYGERYEIDVTDHPNDEGWTGAEISTTCRIARMLDLTITEASLYVVPLVETMAERINDLRSWAEGRCVDANLGGRFRPKKEVATGRRVRKRKEAS